MLFHMNDEELQILRTIYRRSHALRQNNASLDEVASDLGVHPGRLRDACRLLREQGLVLIHGRFLQLTPAGMSMVNQDCADGRTPLERASHHDTASAVPQNAGKTKRL
jgi:predicted transcriptional regulator